MEVVFMQKNLKTELYNNKVKLTPKTKNKCYFIWQIEKVAVSLYQQKGNKTITNKLRVMKSEIIYRNRTIIEGTNGVFTAYYSNYSSNLTKDFKTLEAAKNQIDKWLKK